MWNLPKIEFCPSAWLKNGHLQTVAAFCFPGITPPYRAVQHLCRLSDGDRIVLHDDRSKEWPADGRAVLLLHGMAGCHGSGYMRRLAHNLRCHRTRVFRMDMRGCGAGVSLAKGIGHAGRSGDLEAALSRIEHLCPRASLTIVGFSLGGNIVLKYLGEKGKATPTKLDSAIVVAPPVDLEACSRNILQPKNRLYDRAFVRTLAQRVRGQKPFNSELAQLHAKTRPASLFEFDDRVTAPLSGFSSASEYYDTCSSSRVTGNITIPTLVVFSEDDPLVPARFFRDVNWSASTSIYSTRHGGHVGYIGQPNSDPNRRWLDWRLTGWIQGLSNRTAKRP